MKIRTLEPTDHAAVAELIHGSTNAWYQANRGFEVFTGDPCGCLLFPETYAALDPGAGIVAEDGDGRLVGSCFLHPRETHIAIGIVNTAPDAGGKGVASAMMDEAIARAEAAGLPLRLVSSAMNLDSFSLYSRKGFRPIEFYQDMFVEVPEGGLGVDQNPAVRAATVEDIPAIVSLEREISGIARPGDYGHFIEDAAGIWSLLVHEEGGEIGGFLGSVHHPASNMLGPGVARDVAIASALLAAQLDAHRGRAPVFLVPSRFLELAAFAYGLGARNCELHVLQVRGEGATPEGVTFPTFMPETG